MKQPILLLVCLGAMIGQAVAGTPKAENLLSARRSLFKENKGQVADQNGKPRPDVKYLYAAPGLRLALKAGGFSYEVVKTERCLKIRPFRGGGWTHASLSK